VAPRRASWRDDRGQGMVEYAVILGLVAIGLVLALLLLRGGVGNVFGRANQAIEAASPSSAGGGSGPSGGAGCGDAVGGGQGGGCHTGQE